MGVIELQHRPSVAAMRAKRADRDDEEDRIAPEALGGGISERQQ